MAKSIMPGATLGVFGGGQLGKMFCAAANRMGYAVAVLDPDPDAPAMQVAQHPIPGELDDLDAIGRLVRASEAITVEFENVPSESIRHAAGSRRVCPDAGSVAVAQSRIEEKRFVESLGIPVGPWIPVRSASDIEGAADGLFPGRLKRAQMGYDGKHQFRVATKDEAAKRLEDGAGGEFVLEKELSLAGELALIGVRAPSSEVQFLPASETRHKGGILDLAIAPASFSGDIQGRARDCALRIIEALGYCGVLCVEFFLTSEGELLANELAPRPHNSGHHSIESCFPSQFELQVRALCDLPCREPVQRSPAAMLNLLGECWDEGQPDWRPVLADPGAALHLYGKRAPRPGRKMGHITFLAESAAEAERRAQAAKDELYGARARIQSQRA